MNRIKVLAPGTHTLADGTVTRVENADWCRETLTAVERRMQTIYRLAGVPGLIERDSFRPLSADSARLFIDQSVETEVHTSHPKHGHRVQYLNCTREMASMFIAYCESMHAVYIRDLKAVLPHPVYGMDYGYNERYQTYIAADHVRDIEPVPPDDLIEDFGLSPTSRANFYALLLTILQRPHITGPVPLFIVTAPVPGAGKSLLIDAIAGLGVYGKPVPAMVWPKDDEEIRKAVTASLVSGSRLVCIDNVASKLDSPALASLVTTSVWHDRILGKSQVAEVPNTLTLVCTGNHVEASGELSRRAVIIDLNPGVDSPETRTGWKHPDIRAAAAKRRPQTLAYLLGLIASWHAADRPHPSLVMGSFESWSRYVLGPLHAQGIQALDGWVAASHSLDRDRQDAEIFLSAWYDARGDAPATATELLGIAEAVGAWEPLLASRINDKGKATVLGLRIQRLVGSVLGRYAVSYERKKDGRYYRLDRVTPGDTV